MPGIEQRAVSHRTERTAEVVLAAAIVYLLALSLTLALRSDWHASGVRSTVFAASFLAIAGLLRTLFRSRAERKVGVALAIVSAGLAVYAAEILLTALDRPVPRAKVAESRGLPFDERHPLEVLRDLRAAGQEAYPIVGPAWFLERTAGGLFPLAGLSRKTTVYCNESGEFMVYVSDQHGFQNTPPHWPERADVVLVGDSFTHGACVGPGEDIAGHLRRRGFSAVNLGMGSDGPLLELATLVEYAAGLEPELVVWNYFEGNDLEDLEAELRSPWLRRYLEDETFSQGLRERQEEIDDRLKAHFDEILHWELAEGFWAAPARLLAPYRRQALWQGFLGIVKLRRLRQRSSLVAAPRGVVGGLRDPDPAFAEVLSRANRLVSSWGGELAFVYLPDYHRFSGKKSFPHREGVLAAAGEVGLPVLDLVPVFSRVEDPLALFPLRRFGHYTPEGYGLVAREIEAYWRSRAAAP